LRGICSTRTGTLRARKARMYAVQPAAPPRESPAAALRASDAASPAFWSALCPELAVEGRAEPGSAKIARDAAWLPNLKREGYVELPGAIDLAHARALTRAVARLHERGIPLAFSFVYEESWRLFQSLSGFLEVALGVGYRALPDFWVWRVLTSDDAKGWGPHRDRLVRTLDQDNSPQTLTVWIALSDATPLNGCMYVLPAHLDPRITRRKWDNEDGGAAIITNPQDIRALPVAAGTALCWNQAVLHWGGRASRLGDAPRVSAAFEFQRGDRAPFNEPLLDPRVIPPFERRIGLIAKQVLQYRHMYPLESGVEDVVLALQEQYRL
jgi:hypothetical protein